MTAAYRSAPVYLGIDLGGTNIKSGVVDGDGSLSVVDQRRDRSRSRSPQAGIERLAEAGIGPSRRAGFSCGPDRGRRARLAAERWTSRGLLGASQPPRLNGLPIRRLLSDRLKEPIVLQNDARCRRVRGYWSAPGEGRAQLGDVHAGDGHWLRIVVDGLIIEGCS